MIAPSNAMYAVAEYPGISPADVHAAMAYCFDNVEEIRDGFRKDEERARWAEETLPSQIPPEMKEKLGGESRSDSISTRPMGKRLWGRLPACPMQARRLHQNKPERCEAGSPGRLAGRKVTRSCAPRTSAESPLAIVRKRPESRCGMGRAKRDPRGLCHGVGVVALSRDR